MYIIVFFFSALKQMNLLLFYFQGEGGSAGPGDPGGVAVGGVPRADGPVPLPACQGDRRSGGKIREVRDTSFIIQSAEKSFIEIGKSAVVGKKAEK